MAVTISDTITVRAEKAVAAYLRGHRDDNADDEAFSGDIDFACSRSGDLNGVNILEGRNTSRRVNPSIVVTCQQAEKLWDEADLYRVVVEVTHRTHRHESGSSVEKAEVKHNARSKTLLDLIRSEEELKAAMNKPELPTADSRDVIDFTIEAGWMSNHYGEIQSEEIHETFEIELICYPFDTLPKPTR